MSQNRGEGNGIYTGLLSVDRYPALIRQSPMNAMCWLESRICHGKVTIHPAEPGVFFFYLIRQVERISKEYSPLILLTCLRRQRTPGSAGWMMTLPLLSGQHIVFIGDFQMRAVYRPTEGRPV